jgi:hypothetical protein
VVVARLALEANVCAPHRLVVGTDGFEHAKPVFVEEYARPGRPKPVSPFMDSNAPAPLSKRGGRGQAGKTRPRDFGVSLHFHFS